MKFKAIDTGSEIVIERVDDVRHIMTLTKPWPENIGTRVWIYTVDIISDSHKTSFKGTSNYGGTIEGTGRNLLEAINDGFWGTWVLI